MSKKKRPVRDSVFVFVVGMGMIVTALAFEAKAETPDSMARCYALASVAGKFEAAKELRVALRQHRIIDNDGITYRIGFTMGFLSAMSQGLKLEAFVIAEALFNEECKE